MQNINSLSKKYLYILICFLINSANVFSQKYDFKTVIDLEALPVIAQGNTGTCWSFATSSFLESEILKLSGKKIDLSEMYQVRNTYPLKAENYVMRQGKAQFSEGGLAHDVINSAKEYGLVPVEAFSGLSDKETNHNHAEMVAVLEAMLKVYTASASGKLSNKWKNAVDNVLNVYLGENPKSFTYEGKSYTPKSFLEATKLDLNNYITITSFTHKPYYKSFILNVPDNFSNGSMYNVPLNEFISILDNALAKGYTASLDCDVSENSFATKNGVAFIPFNDEDIKKGAEEIVKEKDVTANLRQENFENFATTDDHLMHITGKVQDQNGNIYYKVKNSWGTDQNRVANGGYMYMSVPYIRMKAISIMINKNALDTKTKNLLAL